MISQSIQDFLSGAVAGLSFRLTGHPFDTIKVRMQMKEHKIPFYRAAYEILQKEGIRAFYKGMLSPLLADIPSNAVMFSIYEYVFRTLNPNPLPNQAYLKEWFIAGGISGIGYATVIAPAEMLKCVMQMQYEYLPKEYTSPLQSLITFVKVQGIRSLFKGLVSTIARDIPQNAGSIDIKVVFFATFEYSRHYFKLMNSDGELGFFQALLCGGNAGLFCCLASYPFDIIKTRIQCEIMTKKEERIFKARYFDGGVSECAKVIQKQFGIRGFFNGFPSCVTYYIIGCSAQFTGYHYAQEMFSMVQRVH